MRPFSPTHSLPTVGGSGIAFPRESSPRRTRPPLLMVPDLLPGVAPSLPEMASQVVISPRRGMLEICQLRLVAELQLIDDADEVTNSKN